MISRAVAIFTLGGAALLASVEAGATCMPRETAPGAFRNQPRVWGTTDSGPIIDGFLDLRRDNGLAEIEHGVDLSHHNTGVLYEQLRSCGATFAIVKMDRRFAAHRRALEAQSIQVIPYFYLSVVGPDGTNYRNVPSRFSNGQAELSREQVEALLTTARAIGAAKARQFLVDYGGHYPTARPLSLAGISGLFIALDVEETFGTRPSTPLQRRYFGRFYAAMLTSWVTAVRREFADAVIIFYTFPAVYTDYLQYAYPSDNAVIHGMPVWLARTRGDGSDFNLSSDRNLQRICLSSSGGNRCILHQYSHRATFGFPPSSAAVPPHIDVNRLFMVRQVVDTAGTQYVRRD